jgi:hypothetical protein
VSLVFITNKRTTLTFEYYSWRRIKHDFLHHFHSPRVDLLVWILVTKLAPTYYRKLDTLFTDTGRNRELASWRKAFKHTWRKLEGRTVSEPINDAYRPDVNRWVCTCPAFVVSRFLICKHLVHLVQKVPPTFFIEAERYRSPPFWRHPALKPCEASSISDATSSSSSHANDLESPLEESAEGAAEDDELPYEDDDDDLILAYDGREDQSSESFHAELGEIIELMRNFAAGLEYQLRYEDRRMLDILQREGRGFIRMAKNCLDLERQENTNRGEKRATWQMGTAMFYRPRPRLSELNT